MGSKSTVPPIQAVKISINATANDRVYNCDCLRLNECYALDIAFGELSALCLPVIELRWNLAASRYYALTDNGKDVRAVVAKEAKRIQREAWETHLQACLAGVESPWGWPDPLTETEEPERK